MWIGVEEALRAYVEALTGELDRLARHLARDENEPARNRLATRLATMRDRLRGGAKSGPPVRVDALHRLAIVAEDRGWLDAGEAILLRKLAFRVAFYLRRGTQDDSGP